MQIYDQTVISQAPCSSLDNHGVFTPGPGINAHSQRILHSPIKVTNGLFDMLNRISLPLHVLEDEGSQRSAEWIKFCASQGGSKDI